jgi:hypothetical protein
MNTVRLICAVALHISSTLVVGNAFSAELAFPRDGWASWQVPALDDAPDWCCYSDWNSRDDRRPSCALDGKHSGYGSRDEQTTDFVRVYARFADGKVDRLRALSATCPVQTGTAIRDLGTPAVDDSARWLTALATGHDIGANTQERLAHDSLAALAIHRGEVAHDALVSIARRATDKDSRKQAVFWLARLRGREGAQIATSIMFNDADAWMREHAAFSVSQSISPTADQDLIRLANTDADAKVRAHAWFSLAMTKSSAAEAAIEAALRKEDDENVRERAIFALSQLPDERAPRALIKVAQDKSLPREERKRAVFWLAQSESSAAQTYLQEVLAAAED